MMLDFFSTLTKWIRPSLLLKREWSVYFLSEHPGTDLPMAVLRSLFPRGNLRELADPSKASRNGFVYIGHGDESGVFSSEGYSFGLRNRLAKPADINLWPATPQIWWCCFSACWLGSLQRSDWVGFGDITGHDARGHQRRWWKRQLKRVMQAMLITAEGASGIGNVKVEAEEVYRLALRGYETERRLSYATLLFARLLKDGLTAGDKFGRLK